MISLRSLHHLSFSVPDVTEAKRFWCDLLGFAEIARPDLGFAGVWLRGFGMEVHLLVPRRPAEAVPVGLDPTRNHVAFQVEDLAAVRETLKGAGAEILEGFGGRRQLFVLDPGANVIEFIQP